MEASLAPYGSRDPWHQSMHADARTRVRTSTLIHVRSKNTFYIYNTFANVACCCFMTARAGGAVPVNDNVPVRSQDRHRERVANLVSETTSGISTLHIDISRDHQEGV